MSRLHTIVGAGKTEGSMAAGKLEADARSGGELHRIGATTCLTLSTRK